MTTPASPAYLAEDLKHLPVDESEARAQLELARRVADRLARGFYKDRLVITVSLEKTANTVIGLSIAKLQAELGPDDPAPGSTFGTRRNPRYINEFDPHVWRAFAAELRNEDPMFAQLLKDLVAWNVVFGWCLEFGV